MPATEPGLDGASSAFEPAAVLAMVEGDRELLAELLEVLREEAPRRLIDLQACLAVGDADGIARAAHRMRGAISCFGTGRAWAAADAVEAAARRLCLAAVARGLLELEQAVEALQTELGSFLEGRS